MNVNRLKTAEYKQIFRRLVFGTLFTIIAFIIFLAGGFFWLDHEFHAPYPTDAELIRIFQENKPDFNRLVQMSNQDSKVVRIAPDFTMVQGHMNWPRPESELGFSMERWNEYRSLFKKLHLESGLSRHEGRIVLTASSRGLAVTGSGKGFTYATRKVFSLSPSLDKIPFPVKSNVPVYKKLEGNWYLYYSFDD